MKKNILVILLGLSIVFVSCNSSDDPKPNPKPEVSINYTSTFKSIKIIEFNEIDHVGKIQNISKENVSTYLGKNVETIAPKELQFKKDSLYIIREYDLLEKYKTKWEGKKLYLYNKPLNTWNYCGNKLTDKQFSLNTGFYIIKSITNQRKLKVIGHEYYLESYNDVQNISESSIIWLNANYLFETKE